MIPIFNRKYKEFFISLNVKFQFERMLNTYIEINLSNLKKNFMSIRSRAAGKKILAVVKADAYGHGMAECAKALVSLKKNSPDYFGVAMLQEGIELRESGVLLTPLLCFAPMQIPDAEEYIKHNIMPTLSDEISAEKLLKKKLKSTLKIHLNIDTGMGLTGIQHYNAYEIIKSLSVKKNVKIEGIYTIFATADKKDKSFAAIQMERFNSLLKKLKENGINPGIVHAANSAAVLNLKGVYFDMVRTGSSLYGFYPSKEVPKSVKLLPVMSLFSYISVVKRLKKGESVGFGRAFIAKKETTIATIPIGYADGFKRLLSNNFKAIIKGKFYSQIGNVSMDRIAFNAGNHKILQGEKVVLLGKEKNAEISVWDWAEKANSIPYEITCTMGQRIPRVYKG